MNVAQVQHFLNIRLEEAALGELARTAVTAGPDYGRTGLLSNLEMNLEFVSANPTGPSSNTPSRWGPRTW